MRFFITFLTVFSFSTITCFANISGWRTDGTGTYSDIDISTEWSTSQNVIWKTATPGWSNSLPVIVGDKIFTNAEEDRLLCIDKKSGNVIWDRQTSMTDCLSDEQKQNLEANKTEIDQLNTKRDRLRQQFRGLRRQMRSGSDEQKKAARQKRDNLQKELKEVESKLSNIGGISKPAAHKTNGYSSATPISDGTHVYVVYGSGVVAAYDLEGNKKWAKIYEQPTHQWGHCASPRLVDGKLIVHILSVTALDPKNGEILWQTPSGAGWGTIYVGEVGGESILATPQGDIIRASDGQKLASGLYKMPYGSPIIHEGKLISIDQDGGVAFQLGAKIENDSLEAKKLWNTNVPKDRYYASPAVVDDILYVVNRSKKFSAVDMNSGNVLFTETLDLGKQGYLYPSIVHVNDKLLVSHEAGNTAVIKPSKNFELIGMNSLEQFRSTPVFDTDGKMFVRTLNHLFCIGNTK